MPSSVFDHTPPTPLSYRPFAFFHNVKAGLRAACFLRVAPDSIHASPAQLLLLVLFGMLLQFASDYAQVGSGGVFVVYGLGGLLLNVPVILLAAWGLTACWRRPQALLTVAIMLTATMLAVDYGIVLLQYLLELLPQSVPGYWLASVQRYLDRYGFLLRLIWLVLACSLAAVRLLQRHFPAFGPACAVLTVLLAGPFTQIYIDRTLWAAARDYAAQAGQELQTEDVFYLQPQLLRRQLAALSAGPGGDIKLYFLGVAGYAGQDVFMKEVNYVRRMFDRRFGTAGRSLTLINNPKSVREMPIASVTSMQMSLNRIAQVMDTRRDVLFLYLSSHGSHDHRFSLEFDGMQLNELDPRRLRAMLDASGIRHRVIVISACYAGGFIDALKTEDTLVMTAAAADKTSFGCSNEAEFTYFGEAYFDEALQQTDSFIAAFELAKPIISARESRQGFEHSDPRMFVGQRIAGRLQEFQREIAAKKTPAN
ncbi:C13 family peptidase [Undibacterium sp.]|uniref:C13 family peptidase n=1 Tax=Undibacterium sp. TaxID=1914977 RepID=UPI002CE7B556|nr:C13 family peptidase [Undibacterium sp.]HTD05473.1 C13 family peptidase [Undibacterium sp.]